MLFGAQLLFTQQYYVSIVFIPRFLLNANWFVYFPLFFIPKNTGLVTNLTKKKKKSEYNQLPMKILY